MKIACYKPTRLSNGTRTIQIHLALTDSEYKYLGSPERTKLISISPDKGIYALRKAKANEGRSCRDTNTQGRRWKAAPDAEHYVSLFHAHLDAPKWPWMKEIGSTPLRYERAEHYGVNLLRFNINNGFSPNAIQQRKQYDVGTKVKREREHEPLYKPEDHPPGMVTHVQPEQQDQPKVLIRHPKGSKAPPTADLKTAAELLRQALEHDPSMKIVPSEDGRSFRVVRVIEEEF